MKYKVSLSTKINPKKLKKGSGIIVIEPDDYEKEEVSAIKKKGYIVLAYLSVGTVEKERSWWDKYKHLRLKRLEDWPNEYYVDVRKKEWQNHLYARTKTLMSKGYSGLWCDNLDVYEYCKSKEMFEACRQVLKELKRLSGHLMVNGGSEFFDKAMDKKLNLREIVSGVTQEEVFSRITNYSGKGKFGTQTKDMHKFYVGYMKRLKKNGVLTFLLEYTRNILLKRQIKQFCKKYGMTGYCISEDVDL